MRHHKAPTPAAAEASRGRTGDDRLDEQIAREAIPQHQTLQAVTSGRTCIGHLLSRGKAGVEAFDAAGHSLGLFPTTKTAADAICAKAVPP